MFGINLQYFGGRGAGSKFGPGSSDFGTWSAGPGEHIADTLKEAIGTKGEQKSVATAIVEANPNFSRDYKEFSHNCQRVVVAYELLRRGYDVEALPTYKGDKLNTVPYSKDGIFHGRWRGAFQNAKTESVGASTGSGVMENITKKMQQYGNGARAVVQIFYNRGGGHVFNVENDNGRVVYIEAQAGKLKDRDMQELMTNRVRTGDVNIVRVDNLRISDRARNFVRPRKKK